MNQIPTDATHAAHVATSRDGALDGEQERPLRRNATRPNLWPAISSNPAIKSYHGCRLNDPNGKATDLRMAWPACIHYKVEK